MMNSARTTRASDQFAVMAVAAGVGVLAAIVVLGSSAPKLLVAAPIGAIGLVLAAQRPLVTLVVMVAIETTNAAGVLTPQTHIPIFQASMALGLLAIGLGLRDQQLRERLNRWTGICAGLVAVFLATQLVATIDSASVSASLSDVRRNALDLLFLLIVMVLIQMTARPWTVATTVVVCLAALSLLTVVDYLFFGGTASFGGFSTLTTADAELATTPRYAGPTSDSNFWGRHLVMGLPLAAALLTRAARSGHRKAAACWCLAIFAIFAGIYLTQSRGTFLAAGAAIAVWFLASERSVRKRGLSLLPLVLILLAVPGVGNRLVLALRQIAGGKDSGHVDPSLVGRLAAQEQAAMMWHQRPFFGFGPGTFPGEVTHFADLVPTAVRWPPDGAHNLYLQLAGESGLFGLLGWSVMILGFLAIPILRIIAQPRSSDRVLAAAASAAIVGWSVASIGLHLSYLRLLAVILALAGALAPTWPVPAGAVRTLLRGVAVWAAAVLVGSGAFWAYLSVASSPAARATQRLTLVPDGPADGWYSYALDIRSRIELLPTFAILLREPSSQVTINADVVRGLLSFTATADTADQARDEVQIAVGQAANILSGSLGYHQYSLEPVDSMRIVPARQTSRVTSVVAAGIGTGTAVVTAAVLSTLIRRRRPEDSPISEVSEGPAFDDVWDESNAAR